MQPNGPAHPACTSLAAQQHLRAAVHGGQLRGGPPVLSPSPLARLLKPELGCPWPRGLRQLRAGIASCAARLLEAVISHG